MNRILNATTTAALALLLLTTGTAPASAASYEHGRERACVGGSGKAGGCAPGIVVKHWHKSGSKERGVGWVYASTNPTAGGRAYHARWLYQRPGGKLTAASGWKRAPRVKGAGFMETHWGQDGRTGPQYPVHTKICVQIKETGTQACVKLT